MMVSKKILVMGAGFISFCLAAGWGSGKVSAQSVSGISANSSSVPVYGKYELHFNAVTTATNNFYQYDEAPPAGVAPKTGVTIEGVFTTPSGKVLKQPAFYNNEVVQSGSGTAVHFDATGKNYWVIRFSPQETGQYNAAISVRDAGGAITVPAGTFTATAPTKDGFIKVSQQDPRYFEFSDGKLFWPLGPANGPDYTKYTGSGSNLQRQWMGGIGAYSSNWARWISSAENLGNEGFTSRLSWKEHYPGHDLSYILEYPAGFHLWITKWMNDTMSQKLKSNTRYQIHFAAKTANLTGPRNTAYPYGLVVKLHCGGTFDWPTSFTDPNTTDAQYRTCPEIVPHISTNRDWFIYDAQFTTPANTYDDISIYLDNVTGGQAYVDEFSMKEILADGSLGGEQIRNSKADLHTYVDAKGAAYFDWQVAQGEQNGVYFKYVVHDKNDWIQNHLSAATGQFTDTGDGYYQAENTKARWLLRQWYRYIAARWGYSTAVHSWELNNEGPPNDDPVGSKTAPHWRTAQAFAQFMHQTDSHPHLATTSFWCCWRPDFWSNSTGAFPDIDYADLHEYSGSTETTGGVYTYDMPEFITRISAVVGKSNAGKPTILAETGIAGSTNTNDAAPELKTANPGIWYHNILWSQLHPASVSVPNYWYSEHLSQINQVQIAKAFYLFIKDLDVNHGGYTDALATATNTNLRVIGQKNLQKGEAYLWIQNKDHTWKKYMDGIRTSYSGTINLSLSANGSYDVSWWNTGTGLITNSQTLTTDSSGVLSLAVTALADDTAVKIIPHGGLPTPPQTKTGDANGDGRVDGIDYVIWLNHYGTTASPPAGPAAGDFNADGHVDGIDYVLWLNNYGK